MTDIQKHMLKAMYKAPGKEINCEAMGYSHNVVKALRSKQIIKHTCRNHCYRLTNKGVKIAEELLIK